MAEENANGSASLRDLEEWKNFLNYISDHALTSLESDDLSVGTCTAFLDFISRTTTPQKKNDLDQSPTSQI